MKDSSIYPWLTKVLREYALKLLGARDYSTKSLTDKLRLRISKITKKIEIEESIQKESIADVLTWLEGKKWLDDERYASNYLAGRSHRKGMRVIQMELISKGIAKEIVDQLIDNSDGSQMEVAERLLLQKSKSWHEENTYRLKQKALGLLVRNGFEYDLSRELVDKWLENRYNKP